MAIPTLSLGAGFGGATAVPSDVGAAREFTVDASTNVLTLASPGTTLPSGAVVKVSSTTTLPAGLAADTEYWLERISDTTCKLHNKPDVDAGTVVDITDTGTGTHTITPDSLTAEVLLQWYWPYTSKRTYDDYTATTTVLLLADHINGIDSVEVSADDGAWVECGAWEPVTIGGRIYYGYAVNVPTAGTDKRVELRARATPLHAGKCRVLQGAVGDFAGTFVPLTWQSMWLNSNAGGALPRYFAIVDADNGNDTTGALSTVLATARTTPYLTIEEAIKDLGSLADGANGALTTSGNTSNIGVTIYLKEAAGASHIYAPGNCTAAIRYNHYALVTLDADPTNTNQVYLRLDGWKHYVRNIAIGNGLIVTPTDAATDGRLFYPITAVASDYREVCYFEPREWKDHIVEAYDVWYECDHLGIGATGGTYTASTRTLTFATEVFAAYTHATNNTIRFSADALAEDQYTIESKTDGYSVVLKATGNYTLNAPAGNLTGVATSPNKYRSFSITTTTNAMRQTLIRNCRCHHLHSVYVPPTFFVNDCEVDHVRHGAGAVAQMMDVYFHDMADVTADQGLHMDLVQYNAEGSAGVPVEKNAFIGNIRARLPNDEQPISITGYLKNICFFNFLVTDETGDAEAALWDWTPNEAYHWLFRNVSSPSHTMRHSDASIPFVNCLVDNSCFKGLTTSNTSVGTILHRNVIVANEATSAPYNAWGDGNIKVQSPLGYSDLTALATSANFRPPAGLSLAGSTIIPIDVDRVPRGSPTSIGAVSALAENIVAPTVTTTAASSITATSAVLGGEVMDPDSLAGDCGIVWNTTGNPNVVDDAARVVQIGNGAGAFSDAIAGLPADTLIYWNTWVDYGETVVYGTADDFTTLQDFSASIAANGRTLTAVWTFGTDLTEGGLEVDGTKDFSIVVDGDTVDVTGYSQEVDGDGTVPYTATLTVTLATPVSRGATVTIGTLEAGYITNTATDPLSRAIATGTVVTNNSTQGSDTLRSRSRARTRIR